ncbi:unnamed protein product, partial [Closterium sp. NIES-54]
MWRGRKAPSEKHAEESAESSDGETETSRNTESDADDSGSDGESDGGSNGNEIVDGDKVNKHRARVARDEAPSNGKRGSDASDAASSVTRGKPSSPSAARLPWLTWLALTGSYLVALILAFSVLRATLPAHKDPLAPCKFPPSANTDFFETTSFDATAISAAAGGSQLANATRSSNATCPVPWHPAVDVLTWRWSPLAAAAAVLGFMICALRTLGSGLAELGALEERLRALEGGGGGRGGRLREGGAEGEEGGSGRGRGAEGIGGVPGSEGSSEGGSDGRAVVTAGSKLAVSVGRSSLLGILVHEIRAPLRGVLGLLQLLLSSSLDESQHDMLAAVQATARHVIHVANNVVDSWRIENRRIAAASSAAASSAAAAIFRGERGGGGGGEGGGSAGRAGGGLEVAGRGRAGAVERGSVVRLGLESAVFDLRCVVDEVVLLVAGEAREKGVELAALVMDSVPTVVVGDPLRLRQRVRCLTCGVWWMRWCCWWQARRGRRAWSWQHSLWILFLRLWLGIPSGCARCVMGGAVPAAMGLESAVFDLRCVVDEVVLLVAGEAREKGCSCHGFRSYCGGGSDPLRLRQVGLRARQGTGERGEAREKGVELAALVMDSVPTVVVGDPPRLRQ